MRVSASDLGAVRNGPLIARYALLGPVAYVRVEVPASGLAGTGLDSPCTREHHGMVVDGRLQVHRNGHEETFDKGTVFYIPSGDPAHTLETPGAAVVVGFVATEPGFTVDEQALRAGGFEPHEGPVPPHQVDGREVRLGRGAHRTSVADGRVQVESRLTGAWLLCRAAFGPASGFGGGWCDLTHWGLVLDGSLAVQFDDHAELITAGDAYYLPAGHRFEVADGATIVDYTPLLRLDQASRVSAWRRPGVRLALGVGHRGDVARRGPRPTGYSRRSTHRAPE